MEPKWKSELWKTFRETLMEMGIVLWFILLTMLLAINWDSLSISRLVQSWLEINNLREKVLNQFVCVNILLYLLLCITHQLDLNYP